MAAKSYNADINGRIIEIIMLETQAYGGKAIPTADQVAKGPRRSCRANRPRPSIK